MPKRSRKNEDANQIAYRVVQESTRDPETPAAPRKAAKRKNPAAVSLGRKGGKKGGPARAAKMSAEERSESARHAAKRRWEREQDPNKSGRKNQGLDA